MFRPRTSVRSLMVLVALVALATWATILASTPRRPKGWYHVAIWLLDGPVRPPLGSSRELPGRMEPHVGRAVADELRRSAIPEHDPAWIRGRVVVGVEATPDCLWYHIETDSPEERLLIERMALAYMRAYPSRYRYPLNGLFPPEYPYARPMAVAVAASAALVAILALARLATRRRVLVRAA